MESCMSKELGFLEKGRRATYKEAKRRKVSIYPVSSLGSRELL